MASFSQRLFYAFHILLLPIAIACGILGVRRSGLAGGVVAVIAGTVLYYALGIAAFRCQAYLIERRMKSLGRRMQRLAEEGQIEAAIPIAIKVRDFIGWYCGESHPEFAAALQSLSALYRVHARLLQQQNKHEEGIAALLQLRDLIRKYWSPDYWGGQQPDYPELLNEVAMLYERVCNRIAAEPLYLQAIAIYRTNLGTDDCTYATAVNNLAGCYKNMGRFPEAESLYREAITIYQKYIGQGRPSPAPAGAGALFGQGTPIRASSEMKASEGPAEDLRMMYTEGWLRFFLGKGERADAVQDFAERFAGIISNLADLYYLFGDYGAALPLMKEARLIKRTLLGKDHISNASLLHNLSALYASMGDFGAAESVLNEALDIHRNKCGGSCDYMGLGFENLAHLRADAGDYAAAEQLYRQAVESYTKHYGDEHSVLRHTWKAMSSLYRDMGDYSQAESLGLRAMEGARTGEDRHHPSFRAYLENMALIYAATDRVEQAFTLLQEAIGVEDAFIRQVFSMGSDAMRMAHMKEHQDSFDRFLSLVCQHLSHSQTAVEFALEFVLRRKALAAEALVAQREAILGGRYPHLQPKLSELTSLRMQIGQKSLAGPGPEGVAAHRNMLAEWNARAERLEAELAREIPEMNLEKTLQSVDRRAIASCVPDDAALVEYVRFRFFDFNAVPARGESRWKRTRYVAFTLSPHESDPVTMIDLGEGEFIDRMIAEFRRSVTGEAEGKEDRGLGALPDATPDIARQVGCSLRKTVFDPVTTRIPQKRLILAVDGDLARLPFEILPSEDGRAAIEDYSLSYLGTGRDLLRLRMRPERQSRAAIVVADPDYEIAGSEGDIDEAQTRSTAPRSRDLDRGMRFHRLPGTREEANHIAALLGVTPWLGEEALETRLKEISSPRVLHIATHGFFLADQRDDPSAERRSGEWDALTGAPRLSSRGLENPLLRSGLALAGANTWLKGGVLPERAGDGILTAEDVAGMDLLATELVVLSACETGLGEIRTGEGVFGLRRSFLLAGASTLVMSLWRIPDRQTQELMQDFYERILKGEGRAEALRAAQLSLKARYQDAVYWGGFICQGDPGALPRA